MTDRSDGRKTKQPSATENYELVDRKINNSWLLWLSVLYMPLGMYLAFVAKPVSLLFSTVAAGAPETLALLQAVDLVFCIVAPLIAGIVVYYKLTAPKP